MTRSFRSITLLTLAAAIAAPASASALPTPKHVPAPLCDGSIVPVRGAVGDDRHSHQSGSGHDTHGQGFGYGHSCGGDGSQGGGGDDGGVIVS